MVSGFPEQTVVQARKLGLLRQQKFRSRTRAKFAAGANERVCGECSTPMHILIENPVEYQPFHNSAPCYLLAYFENPLLTFMTKKPPGVSPGA